MGDIVIPSKERKTKIIPIYQKGKHNGYHFKNNRSYKEI